MRAFIFSLDAFVAFTLALIAIYSLIFFSSVPSAYFYMLTQAHYLARDTLMALTTTACTNAAGCYNPDSTVLDNIAFHKNAGQQGELIKDTIGVMVPPQFGYTVSLSDDGGQSWDPLYDTATEPADQHAKSSRKLTVSTQVMAFGYTESIRRPGASPYYYGNGACAADGGDGGQQEIVEGGSDTSVITCGEMEVDDGSGGKIWKPYGNVHPEVVAEGDLVPSSDARIIKLTIFI